MLPIVKEIFETFRPAVRVALFIIHWWPIAVLIVIAVTFLLLIGEKLW